MPQFRYESLTSDGTLSGGVVDASDKSAAVRQLLNRGETATVVEPISSRKAAELNGSAAPIGHASSGSKSQRLGRRQHTTISRVELANFMRELATALEAGLPVMQALRTVRRQSSKKLSVILDHLIERVEAGAPLHQAAREYGRPFDDMIIGMLRAADASGRMAEVLMQLADLLDRSVELRREVMGATIYPGIIITLIAVGIGVLVTFIAPQLLEPLQAAADFQMPLPTQIVMGLADGVRAYWLHGLIAITVVVFAFRWWLSVPANRLWFDGAMLRIPMIGRLLRDVSVARFTRTLGTLVSAGLPILEALRITGETLGNKALSKAIDEVGEKVTAGAALADPLERSGLFPPLLVQIVNLGERSGRLENMLMHAANAFDRQVNNTVRIFTKSLPPVLILGLAPIVVFVLAAILLPLLEVQAAMG